MVPIVDWLDAPVLDKLVIELNAFSRSRDGSNYVHSKPAPSKGDPVWMSRLEKAQRGIAYPALAAALLKELFPRARALQASCEKVWRSRDGYRGR